MTDKQAIWWHQRYTKDQVKLIQAALNRQPIGKDLDVDGIVGSDTLAAIKLFQNDHADLLKVDGLVGDKTLAALGLTLNDPNLPATRKGVNQQRRQAHTSSLEKEWEKKFNSEEFMNTILSLGGSSDRMAQKEVMAYQALPYLSAENASRVREFYNFDPDDYDKDLVELRRNAAKRSEGIALFKQYVTSQMIRPTHFLEDVEKYQKMYKLSNAEMQELLSDPDVQRALLASQESRENAQITRSQKAKSVKFENDVREARNQFSQGGYSNWPDLMHNTFHLNNPVQQFLVDNVTNPGQLLAFGSSPKTLTQNIKVRTGDESMPVKAIKPVQNTIYKTKWLPYLIDIYFSKHPEAPISDKVIAPITKFDDGQTYGPYQGVYRTSRKKFGGKLNYLDCFKY